MDVNGNDNQPEWGWCNAPDCKNAAYPIWLSGDYPDDPDLLLCDQHIGAEIARLRQQLALQPCGHPRACTVEIADAGSVCRWCSDRAETELLRRALAELQTQDATKVRSA